MKQSVSPVPQVISKINTSLKCTGLHSKCTRWVAEIGLHKNSNTTDNGHYGNLWDVVYLSKASFTFSLVGKVVTTWLTVVLSIYYVSGV